MCIKQIKIRLYKWIYKFLQIGCQVKNTILSVTYTSDKLMQYQLTENSTKMHKDSIETFSIIFNRKLSFYSLTFQIKKKNWYSRNEDCENAAITTHCNKVKFFKIQKEFI